MKRTWLAVLAMAGVLLSAGSAPAATIYDDNFDGAAAADLHGTTPDVGSAMWSAHTAFDADGLITPASGGSGAFLPFTPAPGMIYTLSAGLRGVAGNANWFALGFVESVPANSQGTGNDSRFISGPSAGKAWMLFRGDNSANPNQTLRGDADSGTLAAGTLSWDGGPAGGGDVDLQIVLNTLGGAGAFSATFLAKRPGDATFTDVGGGALLLNAEDVAAVGVAFSNTGITGSIVSFSLTAIPEPGAGTLAAAAAAALWGQRRRRRLAARARG